MRILPPASSTNSFDIATTTTTLLLHSFIHSFAVLLALARTSTPSKLLNHRQSINVEYTRDHVLPVGAVGAHQAPEGGLSHGRRSQRLAPCGTRCRAGIVERGGARDTQDRTRRRRGREFGICCSCSSSRWQQWQWHCELDVELAWRSACRSIGTRAPSSRSRTEAHHYVQRVDRRDVGRRCTDRLDHRVLCVMMALITCRTRPSSVLMMQQCRVCAQVELLVSARHSSGTRSLARSRLR